MPRPKTNPNARSHHKKPAPPAPELSVMVDTLADEINPEDLPFDGKAAAPKRPASTQKAGPKKVLNETTKILGDGLAVGIALAAKNADERKSMTMPEAQSIGHPVVRMLARRVPDWIKPYLPKTKLNPDDAADVEEILATLAKWGMRLLTVVVTDYIQGREQEQAKHQAARAVNNRPANQPEPPAAPTASLNDLRAGGPPDTYAEAARLAEDARVGVSSNGHNPAFDVLNNVDLGLEA